VGELLHVKDKVGGFLSALGITVLNDTQGQQAMMHLIKGERVDLVSLNVGGSAKLWETDVIPPVPLYYGSIIPWILDVKADAYLKANLGFDYRVAAGVDTRGIYFGKDLSLGLTGSLEGGVEGSVRTAGYDWLKASGGVSLDVGLHVGLYDPDGDGRISPSEIDPSLANSLVTTLDVDLSGKIKATLDLGIAKWSPYKHSFKIADLIKVSFGPNGRPPVENRKAVLEDTLSTE